MALDGAVASMDSGFRIEEVIDDLFVAMLADHDLTRSA